MSDKGFHIPSLDGIRAIAFFIVFFSHTGLERYTPGGFGVTIFFFLSGYLITTLLVREHERTGQIHLGRFYVRRALRILPPLYAVLAGCTLVSVATSHPVTFEAIFLQAIHLSNYHTIFAHGAGQPLGTHVYWSLAVEEHFYIFYPLLLRPLLRHPRVIALFVIVSLLVMFLIWRIALVVFMHATPERTSLASDTRMDSILFGCFLGLWRNPALGGRAFRVFPLIAATGVAMVVLLGTIAARGDTFRETIRYTLQGAALIPVFIAAVQLRDHYPFRALSWRWLEQLGVWSYALYLVHFAIVSLLRPRFGAGSLISTIIALVSSLLLAVMIHRFVERPLASLRKRWSVSLPGVPA